MKLKCGKKNLDLLQESNIAIVFIPVNMMHLFQPLDLTDNGYFKKYCKKKFNEWYTDQIFQQLKDGKSPEGIDVKLQLTTLKSRHAQLLTDLYNHMTNEGKDIIFNRWNAAGIRQALDE